VARKLVGQVNVEFDDTLPEGHQIQATVRHIVVDGQTLPTSGWRTVFDQLANYFHIKGEIDGDDE